MESHQLDFWIGDWSVTTADGNIVGTNSIQPIAGGYGLLENRQGTGCISGKSLNPYNRSEKQWQQFWVGAGGVLEVFGGLDAKGRMVLSGEDNMILSRITWASNKAARCDSSAK